MLFCILALEGISSCSPKIGYNFGVVTSHVEGTISSESGQIQSGTFIIVQQYNRTFFETSRGYLHNVSAILIFPDKKGKYRATFGADIDRLDLFFVAEGHRIASETFTRTLGIGSYEYNAVMHPDPTFKETFYLSTKPTLSDFIVEKRYKMPQTQQMFLGNWLKKIEKTYPAERK